MTEKVAVIDFPVYSYVVILVCTDDLKESRVNRNSIVGAPEFHFTKNIHGLCSFNKTEADCFVFFTPKSTPGTIAHECFHAVWQIFKWIGAEVDNETFAYHLDHLVQNAHNLKEEFHKH